MVPLGDPSPCLDEEVEALSADNSPEGEDEALERQRLDRRLHLVEVDAVEDDARLGARRARTSASRRRA